MNPFRMVPESFCCSPRSVVAALFPPAQQMAKRNRPFTDKASKPEGERFLVLAHSETSKELTSDLSSRKKKKTQSDVPGQENPGQASDVFDKRHPWPHSHRRSSCSRRWISGCLLKNFETSSATLCGGRRLGWLVHHLLMWISSSQRVII